MVISDQGIGVSSLINSSCRLYPHAKIIDETVDVSDLEGLILQLKEALSIEADCQTLNDLKHAIKDEEVVVFENVERLFLRRVGGFNLLDDFLLFMHETKEKIYWICTINRYSYYYLNQVKSINTNFPSQISVRGLENEVIREIIASRNQGYKITILKPPNLTPSGKRKLQKASPEERINMVQNRFLPQIVGIF